MIPERRQELADLLADLLDVDDAPAVVHDHVPEQIAPPCVVLQPAESFLQLDPEGTYGEPYLIGFDAILLVELGEAQDNEQAGQQLDRLLDVIAGGVHADDDWFVDSMGQPGPMLTTSWAAHGQRVTVRRPTQLHTV